MLLIVQPLSDHFTFNVSTVLCCPLYSTKCLFIKETRLIARLFNRKNQVNGKMDSVHCFFFLLTFILNINIKIIIIYLISKNVMSHFDVYKLHIFPGEKLERGWEVWNPRSSVNANISYERITDNPWIIAFWQLHWICIIWG